MFKPSIDLGIYQTHPDTINRLNYLKEKLVEKGIEIDRRSTTDYLKVSSEYESSDNLYTGIILIDDIPVFKLTLPEREKVSIKIAEACQNLDRFITIDLAPYEIGIRMEGVEAKLFIRNNMIISLNDLETVHLGKTAFEILQGIKEAIRKVLWEFQLNIPLGMN